MVIDQMYKVIQGAREMLKKLSTSLAFGLLAALLTTNMAMAHIIVEPTEVGIGQHQEFTVNVPNEKNMDVVAVKLLVPTGVAELTPLVKTGWNTETKKDDGGEVTEINWTGGSIPAGFADNFAFMAHAPAKTTIMAWKAFQTYEDGSMASWDQAPNSIDDEGTEGSDHGTFSTTNVIDDINKPNSASTKDNSLPIIASLVALTFSVIALRRPKN